MYLYDRNYFIMSPTYLSFRAKARSIFRPRTISLKNRLLPFVLRGRGNDLEMSGVRLSAVFCCSQRTLTFSTYKGNRLRI